MKQISYKKRIGGHSEARASQFLHSSQYEVLARNIHFYGVEIDFICKAQQIYSFIEVKTVKKEHYQNGYPVFPFKQKQRYQKAIEAWYLDIEKIVDCTIGLIIYDEFFNLLDFQRSF